MKKFVPLNADQKELILKNVSNMQLALSTLKEHIQLNMLDENLRDNAVPLLLSYSEDIVKHSMYKTTEREKEIEKSVNQMLNDELNILRETIKGQFQISLLSEQMKEASKIIENWWNSLGFTHVESVSINKYGDFSIVLWFNTSSNDFLSMFPQTDREKQKERLEILKENGCIFGVEHLHSEKRLTACDFNKEFITRHIEDRFPSAKVYEWRENLYRNEYLLTSVEFSIKNVNDLMNVF